MLLQHYILGMFMGQTKFSFQVTGCWIRKTHVWTRWGWQGYFLDTLIIEILWWLTGNLSCLLPEMYMYIWIYIYINCRLEENCSMVLWFLPYDKVNQWQVDTFPLSFEPSSTRHLLWPIWVVPELRVESLRYKQCPTSYLFCVWWCVCSKASLSICPTRSFPRCTYSLLSMSVLYVCRNTALQMGSSVPFS